MNLLWGKIIEGKPHNKNQIFLQKHTHTHKKNETEKDSGFQSCWRGGGAIKEYSPLKLGRPTKEIFKESRLAATYINNCSCQPNKHHDGHDEDEEEWR